MTQRYALAFFLLCALLTCCVPALRPEAHAARNPFISGRNNNDAQEQSKVSPPLPSLLPKGVLQTIIRWQLNLRASMTRLANEIRHNPWGRPFWLFMLVSLAYGAAHALGPGHGKAFALAYFLERPGSPALGLLFGNLSMFFHVLSAGVLVFAGTYLLETTASGLVDDVGATLEGVSYALLALIGLLLLGGRLLALKPSAKARHEEVVPKSRRSKSLVATALAAGLVPCPGASLVLLFCISLGIPLAGVASLLAISLGMGATISFFALGAIASRSLAARLMQGQDRLFTALHIGASLLGSLLMASLGTLLFLGWWWSR